MDALSTGVVNNLADNFGQAAEIEIAAADYEAVQAI
jgi:hypothetical protein